MRMTRAKAVTKAKRQAAETGERRWVVLDPDPERDQDDSNGYQVADSMDMATIYAGIAEEDIVFCIDD